MALATGSRTQESFRFPGSDHTPISYISFYNYLGLSKDQICVRISLSEDPGVFDIDASVMQGEPVRGS